MQIIDLKHGVRITEPGFYRMPLDVHHSQPCDGVSVTSGVLRRMLTHTPYDVWAFHHLNPDRYEQEDRTALRLGRAMACMVEGGEDELRRQFHVVDRSAPRRPTLQQKQAYDEGRATDKGAASVEFWRAVERDSRDLITQAELDNILAMTAALERDPASTAALGGEPEITMAWHDDRTDLWVLSRPDQVSFSGMLSDYKKVSTQGRPFTGRLCDARITQHAYDQQMALAAEAFERLTGEWPGQVGIIFQQDTPPYSTILRGIDEDDLRMAQFRNQRAMQRFRECLDSGHWPGPGEVVGVYQRPEWQRDQIMEEMELEGYSYER